MIVKIERSELGSYHALAGDATSTNDLDSVARKLDRRRRPPLAVGAASLG